MPSTTETSKSWSSISFDNVKIPLIFSPDSKLTSLFSPNGLKGSDSNILYSL